MCLFQILSRTRHFLLVNMITWPSSANEPTETRLRFSKGTFIMLVIFISSQSDLTLTSPLPPTAWRSPTVYLVVTIFLPTGEISDPRCSLAPVTWRDALESIYHLLLVSKLSWNFVKPISSSAYSLSLISLNIFFYQIHWRWWQTIVHVPTFFGKVSSFSTNPTSLLKRSSSDLVGSTSPLNGSPRPLKSILRPWVGPPCNGLIQRPLLESPIFPLVNLPRPPVFPSFRLFLKETARASSSSPRSCFGAGSCDT